MKSSKGSIASQIQQGVAAHQARQEMQQQITEGKAALEEAKHRLLPSMVELIRLYGRQTAAELGARGVKPNSPITQHFYDEVATKKNKILFRPSLDMYIASASEISVWEVGRFITTKTEGCTVETERDIETSRVGIGLLEDGELVEYDAIAPGTVSSAYRGYPPSVDIGKADDDRLVDIDSLSDFNLELAIEAQPVMIKWRDHLAAVAVGAVTGNSVSLAMSRNHRALF